MIVAIIVSTIAAARFAKPVQLLSETATEISEGNLSARVPTGIEVAANDEMVALLDQFNLMADRLQGSMQALRRERDRGQEHLADVSHELRTPLAALRAFVDLLQDPATDEATRKRLFVEAGRQLERMDSLTSNILELSRFDAGIARPVFVVGDMRSSVRAAVEQAAAGARRVGVAVDERMPTRKVLVRHDAALVGQAVANLVANALKFTARGGSVLVSVQLLSTGAATVTVRDTGVGISSDELPRIFDRFYRGTEGLAAANRAARATGSGLGLAIVKSIVDMHAGRIVVESLPGEGTSFALTFPADPEAVDDELPEAAPAQAGPATLVSFGRRAAALLGEVAKTSLRLRRVLRADPPSSTVSEQPASLSVAPESAAVPKEKPRD
jgi:two-component system sensor histidine kinase MtrB